MGWVILAFVLGVVVGRICRGGWHFEIEFKDKP